MNPYRLFSYLSLSVSRSLSFSSTMPFIDIQSRLGIDLDRWLLLQSGEQPHKRAARCHAFEKEFLECAHGIGQTRAKVECKLEMEDFYECMHRNKTVGSSGAKTVSVLALP
jgi:NADH dehydrogenase (ubiquinone) Fe-S protein 5